VLTPPASTIENLGSAWHALCHDADVAVTVCALDGTIRYANEQSNRFFRWQRAAHAERSSTPIDTSRESVTDAAAPEMIDERLRIFTEVCRTGEGVAYESVVQGIRYYVTVRRVEDKDGEQLAMVLSRRMHAWERVDRIADPTLRLVDPQSHDPGILATLSPRELEVLILIGEGHSYSEIADILARSVRTVERHRDRLGQKLGARNRVELARFAIRAGLSELPDPGQALLLAEHPHDPLELSAPLRRLARRRIRPSALRPDNLGPTHARTSGSHAPDGA
jgi:DNA-binding CsgD family transcriptional regulator